MQTAYTTVPTPTVPPFRTTPDTMTAAYEYPGKFMVTFTGAINSNVDDGGIEFRGSEATLKIDRGGVGNTERGFGILRGKRYAQLLGMPLHDCPIERNGDFLR